MRMPSPKLKTHGLVCGSVTTAIVTLAIAGDFMPSGWRSPEAVAALTGLLATLAAAFGLCDQYEDRPRRTDQEKETD